MNEKEYKRTLIFGYCVMAFNLVTIVTGLTTHNYFSVALVTLMFGLVTYSLRRMKKTYKELVKLKAKMKEISKQLEEAELINE